MHLQAFGFAEAGRGWVCSSYAQGSVYLTEPKARLPSGTVVLNPVSSLSTSLNYVQEYLQRVSPKESET